MLLTSPRGKGKAAPWCPCPQHRDPSWTKIPARGGDEALTPAPSSGKALPRHKPIPGTAREGSGLVWNGTFPAEMLPSTEVEGRRPLDSFPLPTGSSQGGISHLLSTSDETGGGKAGVFFSLQAPREVAQPLSWCVALRPDRTCPLQVGHGGTEGQVTRSPGHRAAWAGPAAEPCTAPALSLPAEASRSRMHLVPHSGPSPELTPALR